MNPDMFLAQFRPDDVFPYLIGAIFFMIPIVAILTTHQQRMAKIMRENTTGSNNNADNESLRRELEALRQIVLQQTIAIDNLTQQHRELAAQTTSPPLQERLQ